MKKEIVTSETRPASFSVTHLTSGDVVIVCLDIKENKDENENVVYEYICYEGMFKNASVKAILEEICEGGDFSLVDENLIGFMNEVYPMTKDELLSVVKDMQVKNVDVYDSSSAVNSFMYKCCEFWLDKATRVGLVNSTNMLKLAGVEETTLWLNDVSVTLSCDVVLQMLCAIEVYALGCYNVTAQHKSEIAKLNTIKDIMRYDITKGYPDMLKF